MIGNIEMWGVLFSFIALLVSIFSYYKSTLTMRNTLVVDSVNLFLTNKDYQELFYSIEHNKFRYDSESFLGSSNERTLDSMLKHLSLIADAYEEKLITKAGIQKLSYYMVSIMGNQEVRSYFKNLESVMNEVKSLNIQHPFRSLFRVYKTLWDPGFSL